MLLAVDVGNTQTHLGAFDGERLAEHWRFQTRAGATGDELAERIGGLLALRGMTLDDLGAVCVSSVVPPLGAEYEQLTERYLTDAECLLVAPGIKTGMPIRIDNPLEVGADRLVNAVAAYDRVGAACVVVDFGTGINFDAVSAEGEYLGGAIAPGVEVSLTALVERAARSARSTSPRRSRRSAAPPGGDPVGGRLRLRRPDRRDRAADRGELGAGPLPRHRRARRGDRRPSCETIDEVDDLLTLKGLRLIYDRNT